jgi:hypothetical protein
MGAMMTMMAMRSWNSRLAGDLSRRLAVLMILVVGLTTSTPGIALAATNTVTCSDVTMAVLDVRSEVDTSHIDMNAGTCTTVPQGTNSNYDSGFSLQGYTEGAANSSAPFWILPSVIIGGKAYRFGTGNPVQCTGAGCGTRPRATTPCARR